MEQHIDLHVHSDRSDGLHPPAALVRMACERSLAAIAIADHDAVDAIDAAMATGQVLGVEVIPAVELSVEYGRYHDIHLLGYFIDHRDPAFTSRLLAFRNRRDRRGEEIVVRINGRLRHEGRKEISLDEVVANAAGALGRPHIARVLLTRGYVRTMEEAFDRYLIPCDVPKEYFPMAEAITEVHRLGGLAVLAHPTSLSGKHEELRRVIAELAAMDLDGLEAYNNLCNAEEINFLERLAEQHDLAVTGGSDFHGFEVDVTMGLVRNDKSIPYLLLHRLRERLTDSLPK